MTDYVFYATTRKKPGPHLFIDRSYFEFGYKIFQPRIFEQLLFSDTYGPGFYCFCGCCFKTKSGVVFRSETYLSEMSIGPLSGDLYDNQSGVKVQFVPIDSSKYLSGVFL